MLGVEGSSGDKGPGSRWPWRDNSNGQFIMSFQVVESKGQDDEGLEQEVYLLLG